MDNSQPNNLPEWIRWIAQDEDGSWWGYEVEPLQFHKGWYENEVGNRIKLKTDLFSGLDKGNWQDSLKKINSV